MSSLFRNKQAVRLIFTITLFSFIFFFLPQQASALWPVFDIPTEIGTGSTAVSSSVTAAMTTAEKIKTFVIDPAARIILKTIIKKLTAQTVNWINNGFDGNPAFVSDPGQFFLDVGDTTASRFLSGTKLNTLCSPFKAQVRLALVKNYLNETSGQNFSCSLSKIKDNFDAFTQDFTQGGWDGWFEMTQTTSGNPYGAYFAAQQQLSIDVGTQKNKYQKQLDLGRGFLSFEKCKKGTEYTQAQANTLNGAVNNLPQSTNNSYGNLPALPGATTPNSTTSSTPVSSDFKVGDCDPKNKETVTPGSVIETQLQGALGTDLKQLELAKSVDEIASALITQLFSRVLSSTGLKENASTPGAQNIPEVVVPENNKPIVTALGRSPVTVQVGSQFTDPGATAYDNTDGDISEQVTSSGSVNTSTPGTYTITYEVTNSQGISSDPVTLTVKVVDGQNNNSNPNVKCTTNTAGEMNCSMTGSENTGGNIDGGVNQINDQINATDGWAGTLAYNSNNNTWLVVSGSVNGRIMGNDGAPIAPQFQISVTTGGPNAPKAVFAPDLDKYLVIWIEWNNPNTTTTSEINGRFINPDGSFSGDEFIVHTDVDYPAGASFVYPNSRLRYDIKSKKFVFVWETRSPGINANLITIDQFGRPGTQIKITENLPAPNSEERRGEDPAVAVNAYGNEYCVAYRDGYNDSTGKWIANIKMRSVSAITGEIGPETTVMTRDDANITTTNLVYNSTNDQYLVAWGVVGGKSEGRILNSCNGGDGNGIILFSSIIGTPAVTYNSKTNNYAIIGQDQNDVGNTYYILSSGGTVLTSGVKLVPDANHGNYSPSIEANTNEWTFAMTSSRDYAVTRFIPNLGFRNFFFSGGR